MCRNVQSINRLNETLAGKAGGNGGRQKGPDDNQALIQRVRRQEYFAEPIRDAFRIFFDIDVFEHGRSLGDYSTNANGTVVDNEKNRQALMQLYSIRFRRVPFLSQQSPSAFTHLPPQMGRHSWEEPVGKMDTRARKAILEAFLHHVESATGRLAIPRSLRYGSEYPKIAFKFPIPRCTRLLSAAEPLPP